MSKKISKSTKITQISKKCKNKEIVDIYISRYLNQTKSAVENLISISEIIYDMNSKVECGELTMNDLNYFCINVGLTTNSSYFRKHVCIGRKADFLKSLIDKIPSAVSTVYEITTVEPELIEKLVELEKIQPATTLAELKSLTLKTPINIQSNKPVTTSFIKIDFKIDKLSSEIKIKLLDFFNQIKIYNELKIEFPLIKYIENESNNVIDVVAIK
jgi:hypothetical protein